MPTPSSPQRARAVLSASLKLLIGTFTIAAAILWLLPLLTTHPTLFPSGPNFEDIIVYKGRFTLFHTAKFFTSRLFSGFAYPAGAAPIYAAFYNTSDAIQTYGILSATLVGTALAATLLYLRRIRATILFVPLLLTASFPLIFLIQRANIELLLWPLTAAALIAYAQRRPYTAAILIGIAASVKLYPILLLGLFLKPTNKRTAHDLPAAAVGIFTALLATAAAIAYTGPSFSVAANGFFTGVNRFQDHYVDTVSRVEVAFDHCLYSSIKYWTYTNHTSPAPYTHLYLILAGTVALVLFLRVRTLPFLNRAVFLTVAMVSLPPVSFTYTLVHLYLPLLLLLGTIVTIRSRPPILPLCALGLLLFLTLPLPAISALTPTPTGPIQSVALLALLILPALAPWPANQPTDAA